MYEARSRGFGAWAFSQFRRSPYQRACGSHGRSPSPVRTVEPPAWSKWRGVSTASVTSRGARRPPRPRAPPRRARERRLGLDSVDVTKLVGELVAQPHVDEHRAPVPAEQHATHGEPDRSEERRVGKE